MLYEYSCRKCGEHFEQRKAAADRHDGKCACGGKGELQFSFNAHFFIARNQAATTSVAWEEIAPLDDMGHPMGKREAAKVVDVYDPDARTKQEMHKSLQAPRLRHNMREQAKREAWREVSTKNRITVRGA